MPDARSELPDTRRTDQSNPNPQMRWPENGQDLPIQQQSVNPPQTESLTGGAVHRCRWDAQERIGEAFLAQPTDDAIAMARQSNGSSHDRPEPANPRTMNRNFPKIRSRIHESPHTARHGSGRGSSDARTAGWGSWVPRKQPMLPVNQRSGKLRQEMMGVRMPVGKKTFHTQSPCPLPKPSENQLASRRQNAGSP